MKHHIRHTRNPKFSPTKLRREVVTDSRLGFRREFDADSQSLITTIGKTAVTVYGSNLRLLPGIDASHRDDSKSGVTLVQRENFRKILTEPASRLGKHSLELARLLVLEESEGITDTPLEVTLGRFIVSNVANTGRGATLIATVEDPSGILLQEHQAIAMSIQQHEGATIELPEFQPHISIGKPQQMQRRTALSHAAELTDQFTGTPLVLSAIEL